ncbi:hypothetical protein C6652_09500 [Salmonella enterica]|nr:hypothetical protein [Salmonella enterica]EDV0790083.1 hypothetical protein [Salmonella enterica subsp. houtenae]EAO6825038.1 hypothetical protein [Salmonella enterica]EAT9845500.1 hypothetical protein [Salmonella enterica]EAX4505074.1 hypothetical protein [Salmonella enterica]
MFAIALQWQCLSEISSRFGGVGGCPIWLQISPYDVSAHNVYYVKWWAETRKPLVIYVKTEKTFSPMPFIVYVVHF